MKLKRNYYKYGIAILILLTFFIGGYIYEGTPSRLNHRAWAYIHPEDAKRDVSQWVYKFEIKDFRTGGGHEIYDLATSKLGILEGHKVYSVFFKSGPSGFTGEANVYFDFFTREILGVDLNI